MGYWQKLNIPVQAAMSNLQRGNRGIAVITLQEKLLSFGYNSGPVDGVFRGQTDIAEYIVDPFHNIAPFKEFA